MTFVGRAKSWITRDGYTAKEVERAERDPWRIGKMPNRDDDEPEALGESGGHHTYIHLPPSMGRAAAHGAAALNLYSIQGEATKAAAHGAAADLDGRLDALEAQIRELAEALSKIVGMLEKVGDDDDDAGRRRHRRERDDEGSFAGPEGRANLEQAHSANYGIKDAAALAKLNG
ncbi:MAG: hypothetical protein ACLPWS_08955, partial [Rhodomicrobium sp.]